MALFRQRFVRSLLPLSMILAPVLPQAGCTCVADTPPPPPLAVIPCQTRGASAAPPPALDPDAKTIIPGTIADRVSVTSSGSLAYAMPFRSVKGRGPVPEIGLAFNSSGESGVLGVGFSLTGAGSAITRCPQNMNQDGEIRDVRFDANDKLCLDGSRLVPVGEAPGIVEYRTLPDTHVKVIGHYPADAAEKTPNNAIFFEAYMPSGLVIEYGGDGAGKPLAMGGVPRAFLATKQRDGRGNATSYVYCFADRDGYTAEHALTEIRYSSFEGAASLEPSRAVRFVYGTKDPADISIQYTRGMAFQSSLRLDQIQMLGQRDALVWRYGFTYEQSPTTGRTLLTSVEECGADGACKPPTRFQYKSDAPGFKQIATSIPAPTSERASPMLSDIDGDGLVDLLLPDTSPVLSTPTHPVTQWLVAKNLGESASPSYFAEPKLALTQDWSEAPDATGPADPELIQPELGTSIDYDQNGLNDVLLHDVYGGSVNETILLTQPDQTFKVLDTGTRRPFPLHTPPTPPTLSSPGGSVHLIDLDGDGVSDRLSCVDHGVDATDAPGHPVWRAHLWRPAHGAAPAGFDPEGERIEALRANGCGEHMHTVDLDADGKVEILVTSKLSIGGTQETPLYTYSALSRRSDGSFEVWDTNLPVQRAGFRIVFVDVNGDRKPDAIHNGLSDHRLRTYINQGSTFPTEPVDSLYWDGIGDQDAFIHLAATLDYNGDGRGDLLLPIAGLVWPNIESTLPRWFVLQASGSLDGPTFTPVDPQIPFEAKLEDAVTLADPRGPRVSDVNGDGASDVVLLLGGVFNVFQNTAADQDVLVSVSDGMNSHEPGEPGFVASVSVSYAHLIDEWITNGAKADDPALSTYVYRSRADANNDCSYPRRCVVGPRRVVREYAVSDGEGGQRRFGVRYEDGRYHRHAGSLGFAKRIITDLDTGASVADIYDNATSFETESGEVFPYAGQAVKQWRWYPGLPSQPDPDQIELLFLDTSPTFVPTNDEKTYFTLTSARRVRHLQGVFPSPSNPAQSIDAYVEEVESQGGAAVLGDTTTTFSDFDPFGNVGKIDVKTSGVDLTFKIARTFKNDVDRWVLGQLETQTECSSASAQSRCRTLTRTTTPYGEVHTEATETDDKSPDTNLFVSVERDEFGNVTDVIAEDAYGHHRTFHTDYDPERIFPVSHTNAAGHISFVEYDAGLGQLTKHTDPNGRVTTWGYDSFGQLERVERPDGSTTTISRARSRDGGPDKDAWRVTERTTTSGGADDLVEVDIRGRPVRIWSHGPDTLEEAGSPPRLLQVIAYDRLSGNVARRSVPVSELTPEGQLLFDVYEHDMIGREVRHTTPWNATTTTNYKGLTVEVKDPLQNVTVIENDALRRPVTITDAKKGVTSYTYGPFDTLYTVMAHGSLTRTTRDARGLVRTLEDPDRGTTTHIYDGFGELISSTDALGRKVTFGYDELGRVESRTDEKGAEILTTTRTWDTAPNGIGELHKVTSPDGEKRLAYNKRGQLESVSLAVKGESEVLSAAFTYHPSGFLATIAYPSPNGAQPFVVAHDRDAHGNLLTVRDAATGAPYWRLTAVDDAGRIQKEVLGEHAETERSYFADKQTLKTITTRSGGVDIQKMSFAWDARLNLTARTDALQKQHTTERFRHDPLERLTCAYFSVNEDPLAPCAQSFDYSPSGNLIFKSDIGALTYGDAKHPHAVTSAGGGQYLYNAVGNQVTRPGGVAITYTPFDLPKTITQGGSTTTFGYDGDEQRIRKTTPDEEILYLGDFYERVTQMGSAAVSHRYYVHSPERVIAVVTRGGAAPGTNYLHVDHIGSISAVTNDEGTVVERRSYDPYGQRRNPVWGQPPPASFSQKTTKDFTGHESDAELGLVNMKGRLFDPKLGRFTTTDPIIPNLFDGQAFNAYSYVLGRPLSLVDPGGFEPSEPSLIPPLWPEYPNLPPNMLEVCIGPKCPGMEAEPIIEDGPENFGAAAPPVDVDTTGSSSGYALEGAASADADWVQNKYIQTEGGFLAGLALGIVPYAAMGRLALDEARVLDPGTGNARFGRSVGEMVGGFLCLAGGLTGKVLGGITSATGIGAAVGVPAIVVSVGLVTGGAANMDAGFRGLVQSFKSPSSTSTGQPTAAPATGPKPVHGNSLSSTRPAQGYTLRDRNTGEVLKYGETTLGTARYTKKYLEQINAQMHFEANGTKAEMHKWQHDKILEYRAQHGGQRPPLNKSDW